MADLLPNEKSVLRLVTVILMETSEEWETRKYYLAVTLRILIPNNHNKQSLEPRRRNLI